MLGHADTDLDVFTKDAFTCHCAGVCDAGVISQCGWTEDQDNKDKCCNLGNRFNLLNSENQSNFEV